MRETVNKLLSGMYLLTTKQQIDTTELGPTSKSKHF